MRDHAESIRRALLEAALDAWEDAGVRGLCAEGRWEAAVEAIRSLDVHPPAAGPATTPAPTGSSRPEAWLRGPVDGVPDELMPVAHSLLDGLEDMERAVAGLSTGQIWMRPGGIASIGFHLRHVRGSTDRLLTYARGDALSDAQMATLRSEAEPGDPPATAEALLQGVREAVDAALGVLRATDPAALGEARKVGRAGLPSTVRGLLFHVAEHARRHAGQVVATAGIVRGPEPRPAS